MCIKLTFTTKELHILYSELLSKQKFSQERQNLNFEELKFSKITEQVIMEI